MKVIKMIRYKGSLLIGLIPVVNLVFPFLMLLFAPTKRLWRYLAGVAVGTMLALNLAHRFVPANAPLLAVYGVTVVLSVVSYFLLRPMILEAAAFPPHLKVRILICAFLFLVLGVLSLSESGLFGLQGKTVQLLQAVAADDRASFEQLRYDDKLTMGQAAQELQKTGIRPGGEIRYLKGSELHVSGDRSDRTKTETGIYQIGDEIYEVRVSYRITDDREGFTEIQITKAP